MNPKVKLVIFRILLILIPIITLELSLHFYYFVISKGGFIWERTSRPIYATDPIRGYKVKPNLTYQHNTYEFQATYYTNELGLRSSSQRETLPYEKQANTKRLFYFGPSFTFGWGVNLDESYPTLIQKKLEQHGIKTDTLNLGTPSQGATYQTIWSEKEGYKYHPDIVVQAIYPSLDALLIFNNGDKWKTWLPHHVIHDGYYLYNYQDNDPNAVKPSLLETLKEDVFLKLKNSSIVFFGYLAYQNISQKIHPTNHTLASNSPNNLQNPEYIEQMVTSFVNHEKVLEEILGQNTRIIYIYIPFAFLVHEEDRSRWPLDKSENIADMRAFDSQVIDQINKRGVEIINPTNDLIEASKKNRMYYWMDAHWTTEAHEVIANILTKTILSPQH